MKLLRLLRENPLLSIKEVADKYGINRIELRDAQLKVTNKVKPYKKSKK